ncbi:GNAT family N-acetyltransferase [Achromobacter deleyi]|uniref:GNAT family N-acetyltransferase n=1 Tax=Achromobacter deleyi TaxID=1353891 RepID=UPI001490FFAA|nr:GNAT family N-acetyltransferase [Achromobacter deleyi]QVQ25478.1 GNAT family N-acetyltransferase [Achromobacter deleyi]UIP21020.1 GNAT family N-acetyltransferase [Achromobacter deleyi]
MSVAALFSPTPTHTCSTPQADVRDVLRVRLEEAALNATAVGAQVLYDDWLVRFAPSPAKRVRSVNVLGLSTRPLDERLAYCSSLYARHGLPMVLRITSIGPDFSLDAELEARGYTFTGETRVMSTPLAPRINARGDLLFKIVDAERFAAAVGSMRGSSSGHIGEHQARLQGLAVDILPVLAIDAAGQCVAAGLAVRDDDLLGLFDIVTDPGQRRKGYAAFLVEHLLAEGAASGAKTAYLQVEPENTAARALYGRYGFKDCYAYWYRLPAEQTDA